jgi:thiol-disulfide isomerase/thioredoxin
MPMRLGAGLPAFEESSLWVNGSVSRESLSGHPVLVHFWAVSCHLCKEELSIVNHWRNVYGEANGLQVIGVHAPRTSQDSRLQAEAVISAYELEHPILVDDQLIVSRAFQNEYVPAYYVFDDQLELRHFQAGERGLHMVDQRLQRVLGMKG